MKKALFVLYVEDQQRSRVFYEKVLNCPPVLDVPGMTEFPLTESSILGLMPEQGIVRILGDAVPDPRDGRGIPRCELYLFVDDPEISYRRLVDAGGKPISPPSLRDWGDFTAYGADLDGHIIAFARTEEKIPD